MAAYTKAPKEIRELLADAVLRFHPEIESADVTVSVLCAVATIDGDTGKPKGPAVMLHGVPALATIKVNSTKDRVEGKADATITLDYDRWPDLSEEEQIALLDHELEHLVVTDKTDDAGRPKLKTRPDDWTLTGFWSVAQRHQKNALEVKAFADLTREFTQRSFPWG